MKTKKKNEEAEPDKINLNEEYEVQYWALRFKISQLQLKETVRSVGTCYTKDVEHYLKQHNLLRQ